MQAKSSQAVSVSLPSWEANVGYEEGEEWVLSKMKQGYPRFYIHPVIARFADSVSESYGDLGDQAMLFPSHAVATRCKEFFYAQDPSLGLHQVRIIAFRPSPSHVVKGTPDSLYAGIWAVLFPSSTFKIAKVFWQHTGDGVSSRRAEFCHHAYQEGSSLADMEGSRPAETTRRLSKGPRRYQKKASIDKIHATTVSNQNGLNGHTTANLDGSGEVQEHSQFIEERFGRNLNPSFASSAKLAIRRRIAGSLTADVDLTEAMTIGGNPQQTRGIKNFTEDDVYLFPTGMSSIYNTHRMLRAARGEMKSICFGFPYIDTLKILQKWGPGCLFYGHGSSDDLDDLEKRCHQGEKYLALFCEFPGNPLLKSPDLRRIKTLADRYDFAVVVDETVGNFMNVHVLPHADFVVSSLTKVFSGDSNVMGGSMGLNPEGRFYRLMQETIATEYEDNYWAEDAIFMERNSRDFVSRIERINVNAEAICKVLQSHPRVKAIYYPLYSPTRQFYEHCRKPDAGYGGLLSATFYSTAEAVTFYDRIEIAKGPSLGTNFTLCSPYTLLAHYGELEWAAQFGVEADLVRISVGLEETSDLITIFERALAEVAALLVS
ncbi:MAG: hypothetical protein M1837_005567 [Sclerophora amabilis]|nr:MAG: hypothetical protein M1837_005567 [Sclerophora amabilis]